MGLCRYLNSYDPVVKEYWTHIQKRAFWGGGGLRISVRISFVKIWNYFVSEPILKCRSTSIVRRPRIQRDSSLRACRIRQIKERPLTVSTIVWSLSSNLNVTTAALNLDAEWASDVARWRWRARAAKVGGVACGPSATLDHRHKESYRWPRGR